MCPRPSAVDAGQRADVHDRAAALREHPPAGFLAHAKRPTTRFCRTLLQVGDRQVFRLARDGRRRRCCRESRCGRTRHRPARNSSRDRGGIRRRRSRPADASCGRAPRSRAAVLSRPARLRSTSTTSAPASARASAVAWPMPWAAPETTATRPDRSKRFMTNHRRSIIVARPIPAATVNDHRPDLVDEHQRRQAEVKHAAAGDSQRVDTSAAAAARGSSR